MIPLVAFATKWIHVDSLGLDFSSSVLLLFFGGGFPTKIDYRKRKTKGGKKVTLNVSTGGPSSFPTLGLATKHLVVLCIFRGTNGQLLFFFFSGGDSIQLFAGLPASQGFGDKVAELSNFSTSVVYLPGASERGSGKRTTCASK